jgi:hypothetical protein
MHEVSKIGTKNVSDWAALQPWMESVLVLLQHGGVVDVHLPEDPQDLYPIFGYDGLADGEGLIAKIDVNARGGKGNLGTLVLRTCEDCRQMGKWSLRYTQISPDRVDAYLIATTYSDGDPKLPFSEFEA